MSQSSSTRERVGGEIGPESFRSVMIAADLKTVQGFCFILDKFRLILSMPEGRVHVPPMGCIRVYEEAMKAGLHFSLHPFIKRIMESFSLHLLVPSEFDCNSIRHP